jgi:hypothetical protein
MGSPKPPSFIQLDPAALEQQAIQQSQSDYSKLDNQEYNSGQFGSLYPTRDFAVANAASDLTSQDPNINSALGQSGLAPVNLGNAQQEAINLRNPNIESQDTRNRTYFEDLWNQPADQKRSFTLGPQDLASIYTSNSGNPVAFQNAINNINFQGSQLAQQNSAGLLQGLAGLGGSLSKVGSSFSNAGASTGYTDPYLNIGGYGSPLYANSSNYYDSGSGFTPSSGGYYDSGSGFTPGG